MSEGTSIYYDKIRNQFLQAFSEREKRERDLTPNTFDAFSEADEAYARSAVKLLEAGAKARVEDDIIVIDAGERECEIYKEKVIELMGKDEFYDFFPDLIETSIVDEDDVECAVEPDNSEDPAPNEEAANASANTTPPPVNPFMDPQMVQMAQTNPFYAFMQMMLTPFMGAMQNPQIAPPVTEPIPENKEEKKVAEPAKEKEILGSTISDIQDKTERLEKEKLNAEKSFKVILEKSKRLESELNRRVRAQREAEDKLGEATAEKDAAVKAMNKAVSEKDKILKESDSLKGKLKEAEENVARLGEETQTVMPQLKNQIVDLESQLKGKENAIKNKDSQINEMRGTISNLKSQLNKAQADSPEVATLRKKISDAESELEKAKTQAGENAKEVESLRSENKKWQSEADRMRGELNELRAKSSEVNEGLIKSVKDKNESLKAEIETLRKDSKDKADEIARLQQSAYFDSQTGLLNVNSLNSDLRNYNVREIVMAQVNICGVRDINLKYGKKVGDTLIKKTAAQVTECFPNDKIYRVLGDNFIIISRNKVEDFETKMNNLKKELKANDIEVATVVCAGSKHSAIQELVAECESLLNQQRMYGSFDDDSEGEDSAQPVIEGVKEIVEDVPTETSFEDDDDDTDVDDSDLD